MATTAYETGGSQPVSEVRGSGAEIPNSVGQSPVEGLGTKSRRSSGERNYCSRFIVFLQVVFNRILGRRADKDAIPAIDLLPYALILKHRFNLKWYLYLELCR